MILTMDRLAGQIGVALRIRRQFIVTAESCTGGWVAKVITDIPGSSTWFERGFVTYSNAAKMEMLDVQELTLLNYGAVSAETVTEMAEGALTHSRAQLAVAISGIAGPDGGSPDKPVGTVYCAWAARQRATYSRRYRFSGDRDAVRRQATIIALEGVLDVLGKR